MKSKFLAVLSSLLIGNVWRRTETGRTTRIGCWKWADVRRGRRYDNLTVRDNHRASSSPCVHGGFRSAVVALIAFASSSVIAFPFPSHAYRIQLSTCAISTLSGQSQRFRWCHEACLVGFTIEWAHEAAQQNRHKLFGVAFDAKIGVSRQNKHFSTPESLSAIALSQVFQSCGRYG